MKDILHTKHKNCGGSFVEINIYEDIECDKCGQSSERYIYTKKEQADRDATEKAREQEKQEQKKFRYSIYPKDYGQTISFESGQVTMGDWSHERNMTMPIEATRELYEAMKLYFEGEN